jgi:iron complex outermembrane receptor protein
LRLRGIDQSRLNININGVPLNDPEDQNVYFSNFTDLLAGMQILAVEYGVGALRNGAANYGGSISLETKKLTEKNGKIFANYGSFNTYRMGAELESGLKDKAAFYARFSKTHSDGYKEHSANDALSGMFSAGYFSQKNVLKFTTILGQQANSLAWIGGASDSLSRNSRYNANTEDEKDHFKQVHTQLYYAHEFAKNITLQSCLYANYNDGGYTFDANNFYHAPSDGSLIGYLQTANTFGGYLSGYFTANNFRLTAGVHASNFYKNHSGTLLKNDTLTRTYSNIGHKNDLSGFLKASYEFKKMTIFADLQYRHADFAYEGDIPFEALNWNFLNASIGANYAINKNLYAYYSLGLVNREPSRTDFFVGYDNLTNFGTFLQYKYLDPEKVLDHELGAIYTNDAVFAKLNLYRMDFQHENILTGEYGQTGLPIHAAVAQSFRTGAEFISRYKISKTLRLTNNMAYSYAKTITDTANYTPVLTPSFSGNQWLFFSPIKNIDAGIGGQYQGEAFIDYKNTAKTPAFFTLNFAATFSYKKAYITLHLNNLLNKTYYASGALDGATGAPVYFIQMPFNFNIGAGYRFF